MDPNKIYSSPISQFISMVKPKNLYFVGGRGSAKTTDILVKRTLDAIETMNRGTFAFVGTTYAKVAADLIPKIRGVWEDRFDVKYGRDYVMDEKPPESWLKPIDIRMKEFKHTISTKEGCLFKIKSLDRPDANAGDDIHHVFGDEAKYFKESKIVKSFPALRGNSVFFEKAHMFRGHTFTTDMPIIADNEYDWILKMQDKMNKRQILDIYNAADVINKIKIELFDIDENDTLSIDKVNKVLNKWEERILKIRYNSTLFLFASSLSNIDILTWEYLMDQRDSMDYEQFKAVILSIKVKIARELMFYYRFNDQNKYRDGIDYTYYDQFSLKDFVKLNSSGLRYCKPDEPIEAGADFGNMCSLFTCQETPDIFRGLKDFHTVIPDFIPELGQQFRDFYAPHKKKLLYLRYDRSANNYKAAGADQATQLKNAIEFTGPQQRSGWVVILESLGQGNVEHETEHRLANLMFSGHKMFPKIMLDEYECKTTISSIEKAKSIKKNGKIHKDKSTEKLAPKRLPLESTNMSDAFKYAICSRKNISKLRKLSK